MLPQSGYCSIFRSISKCCQSRREFPSGSDWSGYSKRSTKNQPLCNMPNKTILIAAGGTGGHLYPAIAVAEEIRAQRPDIRVIFAGTSDRIESREVPRAGYTFFPIAVEAPKKSIGSMMTFPLTFGKATIDMMRLI